MKKILFFLLVPMITFSQKKVGQALIDSLLIELPKIKNQTQKVDELIKIAGLNFGVNPNLPKMLEYTNQALEIAKTINYKNGLATGFRFQGVISNSLGKTKEAELLFKKSLLIAEDIADKKNIMANLSNLGVINSQYFKYPDALNYFQKALRIAEKEKRNDVFANASGNMGVIYAELKNNDKAIEFFQKALDVHTLIKNPIGIVANLANLGNIYLDKKEFSKALDYYEKALAKNIEINSEAGIAREYGHLASVYTETNQSEKAFEYFNKALKINEKLNYNKGIAYNYQGIGQNYIKKNDFVNALKFTQKSNKIAQNLKDLETQKQTFSDLKIIYENLNKNDSAYINFKKFIEIKDELENENTKKQISRLEIQYEFDTKEEKYKVQELLSFEKLNQQKLTLALSNSQLNESNVQRDLINLNFLKTQSDLKTEQLEKKSQTKELSNVRKEIELQDTKLKINKLSLEANQKQKWLLFSGLGFLAIIGGLLFYQSRKRKLTNQKLETLNQNLDQANKTKTRFFNILNHDLRSPVANLIDFLHIQKNSPDLLDETTKNRIQETTLTSAENLLHSMEDILLWSKGQMQNFKPEFKKVLITDLFEATKNHFASEENVSIIFENIKNLELFTDENYLKTIIRNLTGNAIKSLQKIENPTIIWKSFSDNNQTFLSITDNGKGVTNNQLKALYDENEVVGIKTGLGLHLIRDLAKAIDCEIEVDSKIGEGTTFILKFNDLQDSETNFNKFSSRV